MIKTFTALRKQLEPSYTAPMKTNKSKTNLSVLGNPWSLEFMHTIDNTGK